MRLAQICLVAIGLMLASRWAVADIRANCAIIAANFANTNFNDVDLWLLRYRETNARCIAEHEVTGEVNSVAKELNESEPKKVGVEIPATKSANTKAVFKSTAAKQAVKPIQKALDISKIEKSPSTSKHKSKKLAKNKKIIKTFILQAKTPVRLPLPARTDAQNANTISSVGAEGWRINCSARFGGWNKASEGYISSAGKRLSCAIRP